MENVNKDLNIPVGEINPIIMADKNIRIMETLNFEYFSGFFVSFHKNDMLKRMLFINKIAYCFIHYSMHFEVHFNIMDSSGE